MKLRKESQIIKNRGKNNGIHKVSAAYKEYKANGGTEKWKAFQVIYKRGE